MPPEYSQKAIHAAEIASHHHPHKKFIIHCESVGAVNISDGFEEAAAPEAGFLRNEIPASHEITYVGRQKPVPDYPIVGIDNATVTVNEIELRMLVEIVSDKMESTRSQQIVAVQQSHQFP